MSPSRPAGFRVGRFALRLGQVAASVALLYMITLNLFLVTPLLKHVTRQAGRAFHLDYVSAYAVLPWRVHVRGLALRGADSHVEWSLAIDEASFDIHLFRLLHKQFKATDVVGDGIAFRLRLLETWPEPAHEARLPEILGFEDPPLKPIGPMPAVTDEDYRLFTIDLEGVDARHVREVWFDEVRFAGDLHIRGRWAFRPVRTLEVGAAVEIASVDVSPGLNDAFVTGAKGRLDLTVRHHDVRDKGLVDTLRYVSLATDLEGSVLLPYLVKEYAPRTWALTAPSGGGTFTVRLRLEDARLAAGTEVGLDVPELRLATTGLGGDTALKLRAYVDAEGYAPIGTAQLTLSSAHVGRASLSQATAETVKATLTSRDLDLGKPFGEVSYDVAAAGVTAPRIDPLTTLLPKGVSMISGPVYAHGHFAGSLTHRTAKGALNVTARELDVRVGAHSLIGDLSLDVLADRAGDRTLLTGTRAALDHVHGGGTSDWWARVALGESVVSDDDQGIRGHLRGHLEARDATPAQPLVADASGIPSWAVGLVSLPNVHADGELVFGPGLLDVRSLEVRGGSSSVSVEMATRNATTRGVALVKVGALSAGFGLGSEKPKVVLAEPTRWFESRRNALSRTPDPI